jgi:iron complex outermembrane receptor protein
MSLRGDNFSGSENVYTGSVSAKYKLSDDKAIRFGVSRSTRIPSFTELYYSDPTTVGDSSLSNEKSMNYQLGFDYKKNRISLGSTIFFRREKDFIDWVKSSPAQAKWQAQNIDKNDNFGIENQLKIDINQYLTLDSNYTFIDKRNSKQGYVYKYGPNYASHLINTVFSFHLPFGLQSISATYKKRPGRDGWFLLNTHFSYNFRKNSQLFLEISNLLNVGYQEIVGIPQPGRCSQAGVRMEW